MAGMVAFTPEMTALVVAPHPDDETLGCGGTIARMTAAGCAVYVVVAFCHDADSGELGHGGYVNPSDRCCEFREACAVLGVKDCEVLYQGGVHDVLTGNPARLVHDIERGANLSLAAVRPDVLLMPARGAFHQEHEALHRACFSAARMGVGGGRWCPPLVFGYLGPEDFWSTDTPELRVQVDISEHFPTKLDALKIYRRQLKGSPHPRSVDGIQAFDHAAGLRAGVAYAEEFSAYRITI